MAQSDDQGFDSKIAGTWLGNGWFSPDPDCDGVAGPPFPPSQTEFVADSQSFTASGLYLSTNPSNPNLGQGAWIKTGPRQVMTNNIVYINAGDTVPLPLPEPPATSAPVVRGGLQFIARIPGVFDFDKRFTTATSSFGAKLYLPGQDPLDPDSVPFFCTVGQHELLRKVTVNP